MPRITLKASDIPKIIFPEVCKTEDLDIVEGLGFGEGVTGYRLQRDLGYYGEPICRWEGDIYLGGKSYLVSVGGSPDIITENEVGEIKVALTREYASLQLRRAKLQVLIYGGLFPDSKEATELYGNMPLHEGRKLYAVVYIPRESRKIESGSDLQVWSRAEVPFDNIKFESAIAEAVTNIADAGDDGRWSGRKDFTDKELRAYLKSFLNGNHRSENGVFREDI
jgi:hypothetical protein